MARSGDQQDADLRTYGQILWRRKRWIVGLTLASLAGALVFVYREPEMYSASAQLLVQPTSVTGSISGANSISSTDVATELQLLGSSSVADAVERQLHVTSLDVTSSEVGSTDVLSVTATNRDPADAARIATAYAREFITYETTQVVDSLTTAELQLQNQISAIEKKLASTPPGTPQATDLTNQQAVVNGQLGQLQAYGAAASGGVVLVSPAAVPGAPSAPKKRTDALIALVAGLVVGLGVAFTIDYLDDAVRSSEDVDRAAPDRPVMGVVPKVTSWRKRDEPRIVSLTQPRSTAAEAYRDVRTSLQFAAAGGAIRSVLITSPAAAEGKTCTAVNLAVALANGGLRVVVVSADLRRPRVGAFFGIDESEGLTSVLLGRAEFDDVIQPVGNVPDLFVLPSGPVPPNPAELLGGPDVAKILTSLEERFDMVIVDSPPLLPVTDALVLAQRTDAVLLVVAVDRTSKRQLAHACERLEQFRARQTGIVLNEATSPIAYGNGYGYYYGNGSSTNGRHVHVRTPW